MKYQTLLLRLCRACGASTGLRPSGEIMPWPAMTAPMCSAWDGFTSCLFGNGQNLQTTGIMDKLFGGWKVNGTFARYSGTPYYVSGSSSSVRCASGCTQTGDLIASVTKIDTARGPGKLYLDPMSFRDPLWQWNRDGVYRFGTTGRSSLHGPGYWQINPAIYKTFKVTERVNTEFRAESFNFTNTPAVEQPERRRGFLKAGSQHGRAADRYPVRDRAAATS